MIRIVIIDDHPLVAGGIEMMIKSESHLSIVAHLQNAKEALQFLEESCPEIILLDVNLPDIDGLKLCEIIRGNYPETKIIVLTSIEEASIITQFLQKGANGFLLKNISKGEFIQAIDSVLDNKTFLSRIANENMIRHFASVNNALKSVPVLTRREKEILALLNEGMNGPQIAEHLFLSTYTIETHRKNMLQKFSVSSTQALLKKARDLKLLLT